MDATDSFDVVTAAVAGVALDRVLWVRGGDVVAAPQPGRRGAGLAGCVSGFFSKNAPAMVITKNATLKITHDSRQPKRGNKTRFASGPKTADPLPNPASASPMAIPILSGNHLAITGTTMP